jgi:hypothetical protein
LKAATCLADTEPLEEFTSDRWQQLIDDGRVFLGQCGDQTAHLGWRAENLFSVYLAAPATRGDRMGLGRHVQVASTGRTCASAVKQHLIEEFVAQVGVGTLDKNVDDTFESGSRCTTAC